MTSLAEIKSSETSETVAAASAKPGFNLFQLWNMNVGFLGLQFGWGLQMANMSSIFEHLGASAHAIPILWLAAPLTGLVVQPIIGNLSDYTWGPLGRRRPYLLAGALLASVALILMPHCSALWMAAGLLWLLDTSANVSMVPFRAFIGDLLPDTQRTQGFAMQSVMVGMGAIAASSMPWVLNHWFSINPATSLTRRIPLTIELSFYLGAVLFLSTVLWTVFTTPENPPKNLVQFKQLRQERGGLLNSLLETRQALSSMPKTMRQLAWVQVFTWLGIFCFFIYFPPAVARNIFGAVDFNSALYDEGIEWAGLCFAVFNAVCIGFSFVLPVLARRLGRKGIHCICLACGGVGLISLLPIQDPRLLLVSMVGFGMAWASAQSIPYAILTHAIPTQQRGIYQGIFNFFVVLPEIGISLAFGWVMQYVLHDNRLAAVVVGGGFLLVAAVLTLRVQMPVGISAAPAPESGAAEAEQSSLGEKAVERSLSSSL